MVAAAAAPCGGTGPEGRVGGGRRGGAALGAHRPHGVCVFIGARAAQKAPNPNFGSCLSRSLPPHRASRCDRNLTICNRHACAAIIKPSYLVTFDHVCHI